MSKYIKSLFINKTEDGKQYYSNAIPSSYDVTNSPYEVIAKYGTRWDVLAYDYLGNSKYWYAIAEANGGANGSIFVKPGTRVIIPEVV